MNIIDFEKLLLSQKKVVQLLATDQQLGTCLDTICSEIESLMDNEVITASILIVKGRHLHFGAGPKINPEYSTAIENLLIADGVGSCGTAAFTAKPFYVEDITTSPEWASFSDLAKRNNFSACWSTPIMSSKNHVIGTFGIYSDKKGLPCATEIDLITFFNNLASLAIEKEFAKTREKILNSQLNTTLTRIQAFGSVIPDLGLIISEDGYYVDVYGSKENLLYLNVANLLGEKISSIFPKDLSGNILNVVKKTLKTNQVQRYEYKHNIMGDDRFFEGKVAPIEGYLTEDKDKRHVIWMARDITERKFNELKIEKLAFYDSLTNLPNRRLLMDRLHSTIKKVKRHKQLAALIFLDLDNFKKVNDTHGHSGGDQLLREVANMLQDTLRDADTLSRIGGDEFVILLESHESTKELMTQEAQHVCERILKKLTIPINIQGKDLIIGASLGISLIEGNGITADSILGNADSAMYLAKNRGKGQLSFYQN